MRPLPVQEKTSPWRLRLSTLHSRAPRPSRSCRTVGSGQLSGVRQVAQTGRRHMGQVSSAPRRWQCPHPTTPWVFSSRSTTTGYREKKGNGIALYRPQPSDVRRSPRRSPWQRPFVAIVPQPRIPESRPESRTPLLLLLPPPEVRSLLAPHTRILSVCRSPLPPRFGRGRSPSADPSGSCGVKRLTSTATAQG